MQIRNAGIRLLGAMLVVVLVCLAGALPAGDKKDDKDKGEKRKGTVAGVLTAKGDNFIEVKADGEEKARKYVPHWVGGVPAKDGGFDKAILKQIGQLKIGSRIRLDWDFEERPRIVRIEVLKTAEPKDSK
jgi:hypothetical protein